MSDESLNQTPAGSTPAAQTPVVPAPGDGGIASPPPMSPDAPAPGYQPKPSFTRSLDQGSGPQPQQTVPMPQQPQSPSPVNPVPPAGIPGQTPPPPAESQETLPWNNDPRFRQFLADRQALEDQRQALAAQQAQYQEMQGWSPLLEQFKQAGVENFDALQARMAEQQRQTQLQQQQYEDAQHAQQAQTEAEELFPFDDAVRDRYIANAVSARRAERAAEQATQAAEESRAQWEASTQERDRQQREQAYHQALAIDPGFKTYAVDPASGKGLVEQILADYAMTPGMTPQGLNRMASDLSTRIKAHEELIRQNARLEAANGLAQSNGSPMTLGRGGMSGGVSPATDVNGAIPEGVGYPNRSGLFTKWTNKQHS